MFFLFFFVCLFVNVVLFLLPSYNGGWEILHFFLKRIIDCCHNGNPMGLQVMKWWISLWQSSYWMSLFNHSNSWYTINNNEILMRILSKNSLYTKEASISSCIQFYQKPKRFTGLLKHSGIWSYVNFLSKCMFQSCFIKWIESFHYIGKLYD